jgi:hypothetical protein
MTTANLFDNYDTNTTYTTNDVVFYNGNIYQSNVVCQGITPTNTAYWNVLLSNVVFRGISFKGAWSNLTIYTIGEYITYNGVSYISQANGNAGYLPNSNAAFWKPFNASLVAARAGDIQYQGANTLTSLTIGNTYQVLAVSASALPAWTNFSALLPAGTANQVLTLSSSGQAVWSSDLNTGSATATSLTVGSQITEFSTDTTLAANSDLKIATQKASKTYIDRANTSMKSYVDTANTSMKSYVDTANTKIWTTLANVTSGGASTSGNTVTSVVLNTGFLNLISYFPEINWASTDTTSYGWLIQRTDNVANGVAQFALVQGGARTTALGGCKGTLLPFQILADNSFVAGTPTTMWTNTSAGADFSTCSLITDNKSGSFHYSGNIPWPGNGSHVMGWGRGKLNPNNTADTFFNSTTTTSQGIHAHNGQFFGVPDSDGYGWRGVNAGYCQDDSLTRQHFCDFSNPDSPVITVINPGSNTSTSPVLNLVRKSNSSDANSAISGISHWRNGSSYIVARVWGFASGTYQDYVSSDNWDVTYTSSDFYGFELSNGKTLVYHSSNFQYLYTAYNSRVQVTANPFPIDYGDFMTACIIPDGTDSWIALWGAGRETVSMAKFSLNISTYTWTINWQATPVAYIGSSYMKLNALPNNRLLISQRKGTGSYNYWVVQKPTLTTV